MYHGRRDENVEEWLANIQNNFKASGVPEEKKLNVICNYVKDSALTTLIDYQKTCVDKKTCPLVEELKILNNILLTI